MSTTRIPETHWIHDHKNTLFFIMLHTACWILFVLYEVGTLYYVFSRLEPFYVYLVYYALNISLFYAHLRVLNRAGERRRKAAIFYFGQFLLVILVYLCLKLLADHLLESPHLSFAGQLKIWKKFLFSSLFRAAYFIILSTFYWAASHIAQYRKKALLAAHAELTAFKKNAEAQQQLTAARNAYLAEQVNPHMLFNALNFIYSRVSRCSQEAGSSVLLLADIMRYSLKGTDPEGKASLAEEFSQISNLAAMNRMRFDEKLNFQLEITGKTAGFRIIPLVLFTLVENVFKHADLRDTASPATVSVNVDEAGALSFRSRNRVKKRDAAAAEAGIGLENVRLRLELAYPGRHLLKSSCVDEIHELTLSLSL